MFFVGHIAVIAKVSGAKNVYSKEYPNGREYEPGFALPVVYMAGGPIEQNEDIVGG
jgi:hypothetical protein